MSTNILDGKKTSVQIKNPPVFPVWPRGFLLTIVALTEHLFWYYSILDVCFELSTMVGIPR
jgi:hypothetical protein